MVSGYAEGRHDVPGDDHQKQYYGDDQKHIAKTMGRFGPVCSLLPSEILYSLPVSGIFPIAFQLSEMRLDVISAAGTAFSR